MDFKPEKKLDVQYRTRVSSGFVLSENPMRYQLLTGTLRPLYQNGHGHRDTVSEAPRRGRPKNGSRNTVSTF